MIKLFHCLDALTAVEPFLQNEDERLVQAAQEVMVQFGFDFEIETADINLDEPEQVEFTNTTPELSDDTADSLDFTTFEFNAFNLTPTVHLRSADSLNIDFNTDEITHSEAENAASDADLDFSKEIFSTAAFLNNTRQDILAQPFDLEIEFDTQSHFLVEVLDLDFTKNVFSKVDFTPPQLEGVNIEFEAEEVLAENVSDDAVIIYADDLILDFTDADSILNLRSSKGFKPLNLLDPKEAGALMGGKNKKTPPPSDDLNFTFDG